MMKYLRHICMLLLLCALPSMAQTNQTDSLNTTNEDAIVVSLLTCSPGSKVYELYGHTALRIKEMQGAVVKSDWVFNYGTFSFEQPNFVWRFLIGQTDYELSVVPYTYFYAAYAADHRGITEQRFNLSAQEGARLIAALADNLQPENAVYRYNFFYNNCTTKAVQMVEKAVDGRVVWPTTVPQRTLRQIVHEFSDVSPWNRFGQDLLLGAEVDRPANREVQSFAPYYAARFLNEATIVRADGSSCPLVQKELTLLPATELTAAADGLTPMACFGTLLALLLIVAAVEWRNNRYYWPIDVALLMVQGAAGCLVTFMFCCSKHPGVGSNFLITLLNPIPLIIFPWWMKRAARRRLSWAAIIEAVLLLLTIGVGVLGPQVFPKEIYLFIGMLVLRLWMHMAFARRQKRQSSAIAADGK